MKKDDVQRTIAEAALNMVSTCAHVLMEQSLGTDQKAVEQALDRFRNGIAHARSCERAMATVVDSVFDAAATAQPKAMEGDDSYRRRLQAVIGTGSIFSSTVAKASGAGLDEIGAHYDVKRR